MTMTNPPKDEFTRFEHEGWERVADKYDGTWASLTRQFIPALIDAARVSSGLEVLDVACGPGYVSAAAAQIGAIPTGLDFSESMIRTAQRTYPSIRFLEGDAQRLPFTESTFDRVVMNFGLLHLSKPEQATREACRVLRRGGRFACTVWAGPEESPYARIVNNALDTYADMSVPIPEGPPYYLFTSRDECGRVLGESGFDVASLSFVTIQVEWQLPSAKFLFDAERDASVRTAALLSQQPPGRLEDIRAAIERGLESFSRDGTIRIPMAAHVIAISKGV
jgi:ubiquinone/menaquinone biosynthesis C-methylase UbiE